MSLIGQMLQFTYSGPVKGLSIYGTMICIGFKDDVLTNPTGSSTSFLLHLQITCQNLTCDSDDLRGLKGFMNGLDLNSPIYGWWFANASSLSSSNCCQCCKIC